MTVPHTTPLIENNIPYYNNLARKLTNQYATGINKIKPWLDTEDLIQECLLEALHADITYDNARANTTSPEQYIAYRMKYRILDLLRKPHIPSTTLGEEPREEAVLGAEEIYADKENQEKIFNILAFLPRTEKYILYKIYFEGQKNKELATELGLSPGRISQIHHRGLQLCHDAYNGKNRKKGHNGKGADKRGSA